MAGGKRLATRGRKLSLRRRREIQRKEEEKIYQHDLTSNAMNFLKTFILPRLMSSVKNAQFFSQCSTITIEKDDAGFYFFQQGLYRGILPFYPINSEILDEALTLAYIYDLVSDKDDGKAFFSMVIE